MREERERWTGIGHPMIVALAICLALSGCDEEDDGGGPPALLGACSGSCSGGQTCSGSSGVCTESCTLDKAGLSNKTTSCTSPGATMCAPRKCGGKDTAICTQVCDPKKLGTDCPNNGRGVYCRAVAFTPVIKGDLKMTGVVRWVCLPLCPGDSPPDFGVDLGPPDQGVDLSKVDLSPDITAGAH